MLSIKLNIPHKLDKKVYKLAYFFKNERPI